MRIKSINKTSKLWKKLNPKRMKKLGKQMTCESKNS